MTEARDIFVTDYDGTITRIDYYERVLARPDCERAWEYWQDYLDGRLNLFAGLAGIFSTVPDEETARELIDETEPDPELAAGLAQLEAAGWDVLVVSAGCQWYIDRVFAAAGVSLRVIANPGEFVPGKGLVMRPAADSPYLLAGGGIDKARVIRDLQPNYRCVAFAGDGRPDVEAAELVSPEFRFATGWLAGVLEKKGLKFQRFARWKEIADRLAC